MISNAKCIYWKHSKNLNGRPIVLRIIKYEDATLEITINHVLESSFYRREVLASLIVVLNIISLIFEIISAKYCSVIFVIIFYIIYNIAITIKREKILIVESLGYQIEVNYVLGQNTRYISWQNVKSVFINEIVSKQRVIFILALLTKDTTKGTSAIIPLFIETMPRLLCLEVIFQHIQHYHNT